MKRSKFTEEQITWILTHADAGVPVAKLCRQFGITKGTYYRWRRRQAGIGQGLVKRLAELKEENRKLKRLMAGLSSARQVLRETLSPGSGARPRAGTPGRKGR